MWKLITGIVTDEIYNLLEENDLLPEEQKGCRTNSYKEVQRTSC